MTIALLFWVIMTIWLIFGVVRHKASDLPTIGFDLVLFVLLALLGWSEFGPAVHR